MIETDDLSEADVARIRATPEGDANFLAMQASIKARDFRVLLEQDLRDLRGWITSLEGRLATLAEDLARAREREAGLPARIAEARSWENICRGEFDARLLAEGA